MFFPALVGLVPSQTPVGLQVAHMGLSITFISLLRSQIRKLGTDLPLKSDFKSGSHPEFQIGMYT